MHHDRAAKRPKRRPLAALSGYRDWQLHEAKARLSSLVRRAREEGPQRITVYGEDAVVVVDGSAAELDAFTVDPESPERVDGDGANAERRGSLVNEAAAVEQPHSCLVQDRRVDAPQRGLLDVGALMRRHLLAWEQRDS